MPPNSAKTSALVIFRRIFYSAPTTMSTTRGTIVMYIEKHKTQNQQRKGGVQKNSINTSDKIHDDQLILTIVTIHTANCM